MNTGNPPIVLTVAGSDSSSGAGVQADLKTCAALGVFAATAITAITAQNTLGVEQTEMVSAAMVAQQMRSVLADMPVACIKLGMLGSASNVEAVVDVLVEYSDIPVVMDPVLVSSSGHPLLESQGIVLVRSQLLSRVDLITPNIDELACLAGCSQQQAIEDMESQARKLIEMGAGAVLVKGGHLQGDEAVDRLFSSGAVLEFSAKRLKRINTHGTGCTLASAIASGLASGYVLEDSVGQAKGYLARVIEGADRLYYGQGSGALNHFDW